MLNEIPTLLLHCCCAPCSSAVLEQLSDHYKITVLFYNPNITIEDEYYKRKEELKRFIQVFPSKNTISFLDCDYEKEVFMKLSKGLEDLPERGERCYLCYQSRLEKTAILARDNHFDYFDTTLSLSPYKRSEWILEIGQNLALKYNISFLGGNYKKNNGYPRSITLSKEYNLYRQDFCGCIYSFREQEKRRAKLLDNQKEE